MLLEAAVMTTIASEKIKHVYNVFFLKCIWFKQISFETCIDKILSYSFLSLFLAIKNKMLMPLSPFLITKSFINVI